MCLELFYSMLDGHPPRRRHPDPRPLLYKNPPVDALRRSVPPDDVGVSGHETGEVSAYFNQCL